MAIIGQVRRMIRMQELKNLKKYEFEHQTCTQDVKESKGSKRVVKTITHFPPKKEE